jgi:hypothetical protein
VITHLCAKESQMTRVLALIALCLTACTPQEDDLDPVYAKRAYCGYEVVKGGDAERIQRWGERNHIDCEKLPEARGGSLTPKID